MSLLGLPNELLQAIAGYCGVEGGGLIRTNKRLHENAQDILWQSAIKDPDTFTKMMSGAAESGNLRMMKKAAAYGADFDLIHPVSCPQDMTELVSASDSSCGSWPEDDELSRFWASPLHLAVYYNHYDAVEWLIMVQGVDVDAPGRLVCNCRGFADYDESQGGRLLADFPVWTALQFAICRKHDSIAHLLLSRNATTSVMLPPSFMRARHVISPRSIEPYNLAGYTEEMTALHVAALHGTKSSVTHLVQSRGMDINERDFNEGESINFQPIHYAILSQDETMIEHLVSLGANPDGIIEGWEGDGDTPLYWAMVHGKSKAFFKLLDLGAKTWFDEKQERKAILSQSELLYFIKSLGSPAKVMTVTVNLIDKTLQEHASDSTRCLPIESEIREALKLLSRVTPEDWKPSKAFSKTAKKLLRNVVDIMMEYRSPHGIFKNYAGRDRDEFADKAWDWLCDLKKEEAEGTGR